MTKAQRYGKLASVLLLLAGMLSFNAWAACSMSTPLQNITFPSFTIVPSDRGTVGTVLASYTLPVSRIAYTCGSGVSAQWTSSYSRAYIKTAISNVYNTNVDGIGIRIRWPQTQTENSWVPGAYTCRDNCVQANDNILLELVQTGTAASGVIPSGLIATVTLAAENAPQDKLTILNISTGEITVAVRSCSIYASTNRIDLGDYSLADINKSGFTANKKDFSITLDCPVSTSAKITFEGKNAWGMTSGVLDNMGSAKNVFVKLYQKSGQRYTEKALNKTENFGSSAAFTGQRSVTYAGEMYFDDALRNDISAGNVSANIIYTLTLN